MSSVIMFKIESIAFLTIKLLEEMIKPAETTTFPLCHFENGYQIVGKFIVIARWWEFEEGLNPRGLPQSASKLCQLIKGNAIKFGSCINFKLFTKMALDLFRHVCSLLLYSLNNFPFIFYSKCESLENPRKIWLWWDMLSHCRRALPIYDVCFRL